MIIAMAPAMTQRIVYSPALPAIRNQLIQRAPMGSVMKCLVYYNKQFWKDKGMGMNANLQLCRLAYRTKIFQQQITNKGFSCMSDHVEIVFGLGHSHSVAIKTPIFSIALSLIQRPHILFYQTLPCHPKMLIFF